MTTPANVRDIEAQEAVLAACLLSPMMVPELAGMLTTEVFYGQHHQLVFDAVLDAYADGAVGVDAIIGSLHDRNLTEPFGDGPGRRPDETRRFVMSLVSAWPWRMEQREHVVSAAHRLIEKWLVREALANVERAKAELLAGSSANDAIDGLNDRMRKLDAPDDRQLDGFSTFDDFLDGDGAAAVDWLIPGVMARDWRAVVVAREGVGKSFLTRWIGYAAAAGIHPWKETTLAKPLRFLIVDLENPDVSHSSFGNRVRPGLQQSKRYDPDACWLWRQPAGIDIRSRAGRQALVKAIRAAKPDLVQIGPAYHFWKKHGREDLEEATADALDIISELRTRFGFGLLIEQHAPHDDGAGKAIRPFGSSVWRRWPEMGVTLEPAGPPELPAHELILGRYRFDRVEAVWPSWVERSQGPRPWLAHFEAHPSQRT